MKELKTENWDAQKKQSSHKVRRVSLDNFSYGLQPYDNKPFCVASSKVWNSSEYKKTGQTQTDSK